MQRERNSLDSFPETFDLNQGSFPNNNAMDHSAPWDNTMNPLESRSSTYVVAPTDGNPGCTNAPGKCVGGWDCGESSSSANNTKERPCVDDSNMRLELLSSFNPRTDGRSEDWSFQPPNVRSTNSVGKQVTGRSQNCSSAHGSLNESHPHENDYHIGLGIGLPHTLYKSGQSETEPIRTFYASSSNNIGNSGSSSSLLANDNASGSSVGAWGSSCKRKALDGTVSGQCYTAGSSSVNQTMENMMPHNVSGCYTVPENLSISSGFLNLSPANQLEQINPRSSAGMSRVAPTFFPSSSVPRIAETSSRHFAVRSSLGHHEPVSFDAPRNAASLRHSGVYASPQLSQPISNIESPDLRQMNPSMNQPHFVRVNEARGMRSHPWNESFSSRGGGSTSSFMSSGERGLETREDANVRSSRRNNLEYSAIISTPETRNVSQDQIDWSFAPATSMSSQNQSSAPRIGQSSSGRASSALWLPHQIQTSQNHQRLSEAAAQWIPFPRIESDSGTGRSHLAFLPSGSSSSDDTAAPSRVRQQSDQRAAAFLMDMPSDDIHGWRALSAVEGRHRLIRQVLSAMRRGVHLQAEDYVLIDPFVNGFAELHDRHRDMRLDVDNMSYEELLALEERIGNVNTGLSEEKIWASMKQRKYEALRSAPKLEPCCICQEDYICGDIIGMLDCGHEFHTNCIKQWLTMKNICPICKTTALGT